MKFSKTFIFRGAKLATTSGDTTVKIWDFKKSECVHTFTEHTHAGTSSNYPFPNFSNEIDKMRRYVRKDLLLFFAVWGCSWHSCGHFLATASMDNTSKVWDLNRFVSHLVSMENKKKPFKPDDLIRQTN